MGGGGGGQPTSSTTNTSNLPEYARPYYERMMARAEGESNQPYVSYNAPRLAGFNEDINRSINITRNLADRGTPEMAQASQTAGGALVAGSGDISGARGLTYGTLGQGMQDMGAARNTLGGAMESGAPQVSQGTSAISGAITGNRSNVGRAIGMAREGAQYGLDAGDYRSNAIEQDAFGQAQASQYMSPYMNEVINRQKASAVRDFSEGRASRDTSAIRSGAFGGYRSAIIEGVAERGLGEQLSNIEGMGRQKAFENAQAQFERDRAASMGAQTTTEQQRLAAAQYGLSGAALGIQGGEAAARIGGAQQALEMQGGEALSRIGAQQQGLALQQGAALGNLSQAQQALGLQGAQGLAALGTGQQALSLQQAQTMGQLGQMGQAMTLQQAEAVQRQGLSFQQQQQRELDMAYQDFINQRDFGKQQINYMSSILRGIPVQPTTVQTQYSNPNPLSTYGGLGIAGLGLARS